MRGEIAWWPAATSTTIATVACAFGASAFAAGAGAVASGLAGTSQRPAPASAAASEMLVLRPISALLVARIPWPAGPSLAPPAPELPLSAYGRRRRPGAELFEVSQPGRPKARTGPPACAR